MAGEITHHDTLWRTIRSHVEDTAAIDIHTHLYEGAFGPLLLRGPEDLLAYHYLQAETNRLLTGISPQALVAMPKSDQARLVWQTLFVERSPLSDAAQGVIAVLRRSGVVDLRDYDAILSHFSDWSVSDHIDFVFERAGVASVVMTNDPLDPLERDVWERGERRDSRFRAALRIDPVLLRWPEAWPRLKGMGYAVDLDVTEAVLGEITRFVSEWALKMGAVYVAVSLPPTFMAPDDAPGGRILEGAVLPACRRLGLPLAIMLGVKRGVAAQLSQAGDGMGRADLEPIAYLCKAYPRNKLMLTVLARENQQEAAVLARKFRNLHLFGCWWFSGIPSIMDEVIRERIELLGLSMTPQHSDARVLDQLLYKWEQARRAIGAVLRDKYARLVDIGWYPTEDEIARDVRILLGGEFERFLAMRL